MFNIPKTLALSKMRKPESVNIQTKLNHHIVSILILEVRLGNNYQAKHLPSFLAKKIKNLVFAITEALITNITKINLLK